MKKIFFLLLTFYLGITAFGQNIVGNPGFAIDTACPDDYGEIGKILNWYQPTLGTADGFSWCSNGWPVTGVPKNYFGYQNSFDSAYAGIYVYNDTMYSSPGLEYREYIATTISALEVDSTYKVTIVVSLADSLMWACDGLGVYFTVNKYYDTTTSRTINATPQIDYSSYGVITDTTHWVTLTKTFVADSAYKCIVIGSFKNNHLIHLTKMRDTGITCAYYYIDSVSVEKIQPSTGFTNVIASNEEVIYPNPITQNATLKFNAVAGNAYSFSIYNASGQKLLNREGIVTRQVEFNRDALAPGFYYYQLIDSDGLIKSGKLLVR